MKNYTLSEAFAYFNLNENVTEEEFKKVYRKIMKKYHTDSLSDSSNLAKVQEVSAIANIIKCEFKRRNNSLNVNNEEKKQREEAKRKEREEAERKERERKEREEAERQRRQREEAERQRRQREEAERQRKERQEREEAERKEQAAERRKKQREEIKRQRKERQEAERRAFEHRTRQTNYNKKEENIKLSTKQEINGLYEYFKSSNNDDFVLAFCYYKLNQLIIENYLELANEYNISFEIFSTVKAAFINKFNINGNIDSPYNTETIANHLLYKINNLANEDSLSDLKRSINIYINILNLLGNEAEAKEMEKEKPIFIKKFNYRDKKKNVETFPKNQIMQFIIELDEDSSIFKELLYYNYFNSKIESLGVEFDHEYDFLINESVYLNRKLSSFFGVDMFDMEDKYNKDTIFDILYRTFNEKYEDQYRTIQYADDEDSLNRLVRIMNYDNQCVNADYLEYLKTTFKYYTR